MDILNKFKKQNILVIGDVIVDEYRECDALGKSAESPTIVVKENTIERYIGGAGIIALHIKHLTGNPILFSVIGNDNLGHSVFNSFKDQNVECCILFDETRQTTLKTRYISENHKLLRVSKLNEFCINKQFEDELILRIEQTIKKKKIKGIIVSDFNYGVITKRILNFIHKIAIKNKIKLFGDSQTSSQYGDVKKLRNYTLLTPNEIEARRALGDNYTPIDKIADKLLQKTQCQNIFITLGKKGVYAANNKEKCFYPAFSKYVVDKMGCGDSMLACSSLALCSGSTLEDAVYLGQVMSSLKVQIKGNVPINLDQLKEGIKKFNKGD